MSDLRLQPASLPSLDRQNNFLQSSYWAKLKGERGWIPLAFRLTYRRNTEPLLVLTRTFMGILPMAYVPHGPHIDVEMEERGAFLKRLSEELQEYLPLGTFFIRYDLLWGEVGVDSFPEAIQFRGISKAPVDIQPPDTLIIDLTPSEEAILATMRKKTRYNIKHAFKKGVEIYEGGLSDLPEWYALYKITGQRDKISIHSLSYYQRVLGLAQETSRPDMRILLARHEGELLAGVIVVFDGEKATYLYGASSNFKRNLMPSYALQWAGITKAKERGCKTYDMFGVPPSNSPDHPLHGLYRFKMGFGGQVHHRLGAWDYPYSRLIYPLYRLAEVLRGF